MARYRLNGTTSVQTKTYFKIDDSQNPNDQGQIALARSQTLAQQIVDLLNGAASQPVPQPVPTPVPTPTPTPTPVPTPTPTPPPTTLPPSTGSTPTARVLASSLTKIGTFRLPQTRLNSQWGFTNNAGGGGLGAYGVCFNPAHNSLFIGGHPYEQRIAEIAIPTSFANNPIASALQDLIDPFEGKIDSINPTDPNQKVLGGAIVVDDQLYVGAYSYYDGSGTQKKAWFQRPSNLTIKGQLAGPIAIGNPYPGWLDRSACLIPAEWQAALGGTVLLGGGGGAINGVQSWGPSAVVVHDLANFVDPMAGTVLLGYPMATPLADDRKGGNPLWAQSDRVTGCAIIPGTATLLFMGRHGMGAYCYGPGTTCGDPTDDSKGTHNYPYRSQVWAYDLHELAKALAGTGPITIQPYAVWELDPHFYEIQGLAFDPATKRLFVSQVAGDPVNSGQPLIHAYSISV